MLGNDRGIALVVTLLIVALLTITVIEFTYSVQIDQRMARHALYGLQASLLARSGVHLGEALLLHDSDPTVDAYTEDWCPQTDVAPEGDRPACDIDAAASQLVLPENARLRVQILDESSKVNLNMTRPQTVNQWRAARTNPNTPQLFQAWRTVLGTLIEGRGVDPSAADALADYWDRLYELSVGPEPVGTAQADGATPVPTGGSGSVVLDFPSLDDASLIPGLGGNAIRRIRAVVTATDSRRQTQVNVNTASREVLAAIVGDGDIVEQIVSQRENGPVQQRDLAGLLAGINRQDPEKRYVPSMLGVRSAYFLIRASAIVNANPMTGRGGIRRTVSLLVRRDPRPGVPANAPAGTPRWTLTRLDWQKESGAVLFRSEVAPDARGVDTLRQGLF
jgi:type II secretory pathway component PulK